MAGCRPDAMPVLITAIEAMADRAFNLDSVQATTHPVAPLVIVNGPIAREVGINAGYNAFGQGFRANVTIGRAVRLILMNVGGGLPGTGDRSTQGNPAKIAYCVAENEAESPWEPLQVEAGLPRRREHGDGDRLRGSPQHPGPLQQHRPRRAAHHRRRHGPGGQQQHPRGRVAAALAGPGARGHYRARGVHQAPGEGVRVRARALPARAARERNTGASRPASARRTRPTPCSPSPTRPSTSR